MGEDRSGEKDTDDSAPPAHIRPFGDRDPGSLTQCRRMSASGREGEFVIKPVTGRSKNPTFSQGPVSASFEQPPFSARSGQLRINNIRRIARSRDFSDTATSRESRAAPELASSIFSFLRLLQDHTLAALRAKRLIWNNSQCRWLPKLSALLVIAQHHRNRPDTACVQQ